MPFDPFTFPVPRTAENEITFAKGNLVMVPEYAATCPLRCGRVVRVKLYKRNLMVTIEEAK